MRISADNKLEKITIIPEKICPISRLNLSELTDPVIIKNHSPTKIFDKEWLYQYFWHQYSVINHGDVSRPLKFSLAGESIVLAPFYGSRIRQFLNSLNSFSESVSIATQYLTVITTLISVGCIVFIENISVVPQRDFIGPLHLLEMRDELIGLQNRLTRNARNLDVGLACAKASVVFCVLCLCSLWAKRTLNRYFAVSASQDDHFFKAWFEKQIIPLKGLTKEDVKRIEAIANAENSHEEVGIYQQADGTVSLEIDEKSFSIKNTR